MLDNMVVDAVEEYITNLCDNTEYRTFTDVAEKYNVNIDDLYDKVIKILNCAHRKEYRYISKGNSSLRDTFVIVRPSMLYIKINSCWIDVGIHFWNVTDAYKQFGEVTHLGMKINSTDSESEVTALADLPDQLKQEIDSLSSESEYDVDSDIDCDSNSNFEENVQTTNNRCTNLEKVTCGIFIVIVVVVGYFANYLICTQ